MATNYPEKLSYNSFYVKEKSKLVKINLDEVIAFESKLHYLIIHTLNFSTTIYWSLEKIKKVLADKKEFIQVHRSFIISEKHIKNVEGNNIELANKVKVTFGRFYKKDFEEMIRQNYCNNNFAE